jgi:hypothetical protein
VITNTTLTPTIGRATRKSLFWMLAGVFLVVVALAVVSLTGAANSGGTPFSATNAGPAGSKAVVQVLRQRGVTVSVTGSLTSTITALGRDRGATLFLYDPNGHLDQAQLRSLTGSARHIVVLSPTFGQLAALAPQVALAGTVTKKSLASDCSLPAANRAKSVTGSGTGFRLIDKTADAQQCFGSGKRVYSLIAVEYGGGTRVSLLGTTDVLGNEHIAEQGNAALALNLLGDSARLVWYLPTIDDSAVPGGLSIADLTPPWVGPTMTLLAIVAIVAAFWRGRRMGPLVVENLPVVVRASETMEGRARLYQRGAARLRALDALRVGAIDRLAAQTGLPRLAGVDEVIGRVATLTATDPGDIRPLLLDAVPATDGELVRLSDSLLELERAVERATRPS